MRVVLALLVFVSLFTVPSAQQPAVPPARSPLPVSAAQGPLDREAERWVAQTLATLTLDQRVGQLIAPGFDSTYLPTDSDEFDRLTRVIQESHAGAVIAFGGTEPSPQVLLNPAYGSVVLGHPLSLAATLNQLQAITPVPLLATADFEYGAGMRIAGATRFPRAMALGATGDERLAFEAGRVTAIEGRAMGVHVNFAPVADVNNNPRNPVINTRSFGEDPARVGAMVAAYVKGLQQGGMLATLKHFPGHGDTETDSHLGLPIITHPRERFESVELPPFRAGMAAGAAAAMVAHIELPALDPEKGPATFSRAVMTDFLRRDLAFPGLIVTDSMKMDAITRMLPPGDAAVKAVLAGADLVLDTPDPVAAFTSIKAAVTAGQIDRARLDASVRRLLEAKARMGLHRNRTVPLPSVTLAVGGRQHQAVAREISQKSLTLHQGRRRSPAAPPAAGRERALPLGARLHLGLAHRGAEPHHHPGTEEALVRHRGGGGVRSVDVERAGSGAGNGRSIRRGRGGRVRARLVRQRPPRPGAGHRAIAAGSRRVARPDAGSR